MITRSADHPLSGSVRVHKGWFSWTLCCLVLLAQDVHGTGLPLCLDNAIPPESRKSVVIDGEDMPVGMWALDWQSANLNYDILRLLIEEVLGYQVEETGRSAVVVSGLWAIAGCREPVALESVARQRCELTPGRAVSTTHLTVETWDFYLPTTLQELSDLYPLRQPIKLGGPFGSLGFKGLAANWVPEEIFVDGLKDGMLLDSFRFYNDSMFYPAKYFDSIDDINTTEFFAAASRCADYPPMNQDVDARIYLGHFGDYEGVENHTVDGVTKLRGRCDDGVWWLSPACRRNRTRCIPWITVLGYGYTIIWHKVIEFNMAIAMASTNDWVNVIHQNRVLNYAWVPDAQFVNRGLMQVIFPGYSKEEHANNLFITEFAQVVTEKWAHRGLQQAAPRLWATASAMNLSRSTMTDFLSLRVRQGLTSREAACQFLRTNENIWRGWVPSETACVLGQGLVEEDGQYRCEYCGAGTASVPHSSIGGTFECQACPLGRYQPLSMQSECLPCEIGSYADTVGSEVCFSCRVGTYIDEEGKTTCKPCPAQRTTKVEGARAPGDCLCEEGHYQPSGLSEDDFSCEVCPSQLECPLDSRMSRWTESTSTRGSSRDLIYPRVKPGFYAEVVQPTQVYKCRSATECPGGAFGQCGPNRGIPPEEISESTGLVCGTCLPGFYQTFSGTCDECGGVETTHFLIPMLQILFGPFFCVLIYLLSKDPFTSEFVDAPPRKIGMLLSIVIIQMQTVGIIRSMALTLPPQTEKAWEFGDALNEPLKMLRPECAGGGAFGSFQAQYVLRALLPLEVAIFFFLTYQVSRLISRFLGGEASACDGNPPKGRLSQALRIGMKGPQTFNACATVLFTFCISVFQMAFELFQCYTHPMGDKYSLLKAPQVACHTGLWKSLVGVGAVTVICYAVVPLCIFCAIIYIAPSRFHDPRFRTTWKFLIVKWKPHVWWFSMPFLLKGFCLSLTSVIFESPNFQVLWLACTQLSYFYGVMLFTPWRHAEGQRTDSFISAFMVCAIMCCFVWSERLHDNEPSTFAKFAVPFTMIPMAFIGIQIIFLLRSSMKFAMGDHAPALIQGIHDTFKIYRQIQVLSESKLMDLVQATVHSTPHDRSELHGVLCAYLSEVILTHRGSGVANLPRQPLHRLVQRRASPWLRQQLVSSGQPISTGDGHFKEMMYKEIAEEDFFLEHDHLSAEAFVRAWTEAGGGSSAAYAEDLLDPYGNGVVTKAAYSTMLDHVMELRLGRPRAAATTRAVSVGGFAVGPTFSMAGARSTMAPCSSEAQPQEEACERARPGPECASDAADEEADPTRYPPPVRVRV